MKNLTWIGLLSIAALLCFGVFYTLQSKKNKEVSTIISSTGESVTIPAISEEVISEIPDDGQAHIVYIDPIGRRRIMVKIIKISNVYRTHIVWLEYMNAPAGEEYIEHLGGTH